MGDSYLSSGLMTPRALQVDRVVSQWSSSTLSKAPTTLLPAASALGSPQSTRSTVQVELIHPEMIKRVKENKLVPRTNELHGHPSIALVPCGQTVDMAQ